MSHPSCSSSTTKDGVETPSTRKEMTFIEHLLKVSQERKEQYRLKIQGYAAEYYFKFMNYILPVALAYPEATRGLCEKQTATYRFLYPVGTTNNLTVSFNDETGAEYLKIDVTKNVYDIVIESISNNQGFRAEKTIAKLGTEDDSPAIDCIAVYVDIDGDPFSEGDDVKNNPRGYVLRIAENLRAQILENIETVSEKMYLRVVENVVPLMISFPENYDGKISQTEESYSVTLSLDNDIPVKLRFKRSEEEDDEKAFTMSVNIAEEAHNRLNGRLGMLRGVMCKLETLEGGESRIALTVMKN